MEWREVIGQATLKKQLEDSINENRISHAQLFVGKSGYGTLALVLSYASKILSLSSSQASVKQIEHFQHPDLHLSFPTINNAEIKHDAVSSHYIKQFRKFIIKNPYQDIKQWYQYLNEDKKQGFISVKEIEAIIQQLSLKSFEGGYKIQIIWMAETMRVEAANKLLKILEEPPPKTLFLLIVEDENKVLPTIISRCQKITVHSIEEEEIVNNLQKYYLLLKEEAEKITTRAEGNWNIASVLAKNGVLQEEFEKYFIQWNRAAVMAPSKPAYLKEIVDWSIEISNWGREKQKDFLHFCSETFRQALLQNYKAEILVNGALTYGNFKWNKFSQFVHGNNIEDVLEEINSAFYHIERNGNPKIIFLDMGVKLTRFLARRRE